MQRTGIVILACLVFLSGPAMANIVVNGDFESGSYAYPYSSSTVPNGWTLGPPSSTSLSKMVVSSTTGPLANQGPEQGSNYVVFQSPAADYSRDCLYQDLTTVAGQQYTISFWVAYAPGTTGTSGVNPGLTPVWDESGANYAVLGSSAAYFLPSVTYSSAYQQYTYTETASSTTTRLDFHGVDATGAIFLDNVSVTAVPTPEPASLGLFAIAGAMLCRRSRRQ